MDIDQIEKLLIKHEKPIQDGVASLLMVLKYFDVDSTLSDLTALTETSAAGTTLSNLEKAARTFGLEAGSFKGNLEFFDDYDQPVLVHLVSRDTLQYYYAVCFGISGGKYIIA